MKILVLTSTYPRWKNDTEPGFVDHLSQNLAEGNTVDVIAPHARGAALKEIMGKVTVHRFRYGPQSWQTLAYDGGILPNLRESPLRLLLVPLFLISQCWLTVKLLRQNQYDIIHAHWIIPQGIVAVFAVLFSRSKPAIALTSHGGDLFALKGPLLSWLKKFITQRGDALTVVSDAMKQKAVAMGLKTEQQIRTIPMGVDAKDTFLPPAANIHRQGLLFVGRLVDKKGVEYLLDAIPRILSRHPEERLTIIGDGPLKKSLQDQCRRLGISDSVTFQGSLANRDIPHFLQNAAITVFPSIVTEAGDQEGSPVAIIEALACGCAAIVADYPGASDVITHGKTGLVIPGKSAEDLATAVLDLLDDPATRRELGENGRGWVQEHYDWRVISEKFMVLFRTLVVKG